MANRIEIEQSKVNIDSQKIAIRGSRNGLLPTLAGVHGTDQQWLERSGQPHV